MPLSLVRPCALLAVELSCACLYLSGLGRRRGGAGRCAAMVALCTLLGALIYWGIACLNDERVVEPQFLYYTFGMMVVFEAFAVGLFPMRAADNLYQMLILFLSIHALRLIFMRCYGLLFGENMEGGTWAYALGFCGAALVYGLALAGVLLAQRHWTKGLEGFRLGVGDVGLMWIASLPVVYICNLGIWLTGDQQALPMSACLIALAASACGLVAVIGYRNLACLAAREREMAQMKAVLRAQQDQYALGKQNLELVSQKYHDLKAHLLYLDGERDEAKRSQYIGALLREIQRYRAPYRTGSEALDVVLSGKSGLLGGQGIQLLLFLDGSKLSFLDSVDLVTIFANAIDNAAEALSRVEEPYRELTIRMFERETWLVLRFENRFAGQIAWEDGMPASSKGDDAHGLGLKSIAYTVKKYAGHITFAAGGSRFILSILFPRQRQDGQG